MFLQPGEEPADQKRPDKRARILLRIFFTTYGREVILLCSGYDKGKDPSAARQRAEIVRARAMVATIEENLRARQREQSQRPKN